MKILTKLDMENRSQTNTNTAVSGLPEAASNAAAGCSEVKTVSIIPKVAKQGLKERSKSSSVALNTEAQTGTEGTPTELGQSQERFSSWQVVNPKKKNKPLEKGVRDSTSGGTTTVASRAEEDQKPKRMGRKKRRAARKAKLRQTAPEAQTAERRVREDMTGRPRNETEETRRQTAGLTGNVDPRLFTAQPAGLSEGRDLKRRTGRPQDVTGETRERTAGPVGGAASEPSTSGNQGLKARRLGRKQRRAEKRARLDDTISPRGEQKKQRVHAPTQQSKDSYAKAARSDLDIAITSDKLGQITADVAENLLLEIQQKILEEAKAATTQIAPEFRGKPVHSEGALKLWCENKGTVEWIKRVISTMSPLLTGENLVVKRQDDIPKRVRCGIMIPDKPGFWKNTRDIAFTLSFQNAWAGVDRWLLQKADRQAEGWFLILTVPEDLVPTLVARGRRLSFGCGAVYLKFQGQGGKFAMDPPEAGEGTSTKAGSTGGIIPPTIDIVTASKEEQTKESSKPGDAKVSPAGEELLSGPAGDDKDEPTGHLLARLNLGAGEGEAPHDGVPFVSS